MSDNRLCVEMLLWQSCMNNVLSGKNILLWEQNLPNRFISCSENFYAVAQKHFYAVPQKHFYAVPKKKKHF